MSTAAHYPHISFDAAVSTCDDGSGYKVLDIAAEHFHTAGPLKNSSAISSNRIAMSCGDEAIGRTSRRPIAESGERQRPTHWNTNPSSFPNVVGNTRMEA